MPNPQKDNVCWHWNSYFQDGCTKGDKCPFRHLNQDDYEKFVESRKSRNVKGVSYYGFKSALNKFRKQQYTSSSQILKSLLQENPHVPRYNLWCARNMEKLHLFESAEVYYRRAIATQSQNATYHGRYAALLHFKLNKLTEAKRHYEVALTLRDDINAVHCHYGKLLCDLDGGDNYARAKYHFERCLEIFENDEECHFYFGQLLYKIGDIKSAELHVKKALYLQNKPYVWHYYYYALICIELQEFSVAKQHLQICLDLQFGLKSPIWNEIYYEYGLLLIFIFNSLEIGMKYIPQQHCPCDEMYYKLKQIDLSPTGNRQRVLQMYHEYRKINKDNQYGILNFDLHADCPNGNTSITPVATTRTAFAPKAYANPFRPNNTTTFASNNSNSVSVESPVSLCENINKNSSDDDVKQASDDDTKDNIDDTIVDQIIAATDAQRRTKKPLTQLHIECKDDEAITDVMNSPIEKVINDAAAKVEDISSSFCLMSLESEEEKNHECSMRNEFDRILKNANLFHYVDMFKQARINDIRLIEHIDDAYLENKIGMTPKEIEHWKHYINNEWKVQCDTMLQKWKSQDRFLYTLYYDVFATNGVMTVQSFFYYFKNANDILYLVNHDYEHANNIWDMFQKFI